MMCVQPSSSSSLVGVNGVMSADAGRGHRRTTSTSSTSSSTSTKQLYDVELHRGSRGFGFAIRGGREFAGMPICVLNIASGGSADMDGRLRVYLRLRLRLFHQKEMFYTQ